MCFSVVLRSTRLSLTYTRDPTHGGHNIGTEGLAQGARLDFLVDFREENWRRIFF